MSEHFSSSGQCLCNSVSFTANKVEHKIGACHCSMCRAWAGGPFIGMDCGSEVEFSGEITSYNSSDWAERGFCAKCGTHLFYKLKSDGRYIVPAGLFKETPDLVFDHQIFIDQKPDYYEFANKTHNMTGAEVFEQFSKAD